MVEISDRHMEALKWLAKASSDLSKATQSLLDKKYADAYYEATRVQETMRQLLEVQQDLTKNDQNE